MSKTIFQRCIIWFIVVMFIFLYFLHETPKEAKAFKGIQMSFEVDEKRKTPINLTIGDYTATEIYLSQSKADFLLVFKKKADAKNRLVLPTYYVTGNRTNYVNGDKENVTYWLFITFPSSTGFDLSTDNNPEKRFLKENLTGIQGKIQNYFAENPTIFEK